MYRNNEEHHIKEWEIKRKPTVMIGWDNYECSSPIDDIREWQKDLAYICGIYGNKIEFNVKTFGTICDSKEYTRMGYNKIISISDLAELLWSEAEIIINNEIDDGKLVMKSITDSVLPWYKDLEATVY